MIRGISCKIPNEYGNIFTLIFNEINMSKYFWIPVDNDIFISNKDITIFDKVCSGIVNL